MLPIQHQPIFLHFFCIEMLSNIVFDQRGSANFNYMTNMLQIEKLAQNELERQTLIEKLDVELVEMKRSKANGLCCGAGGAQMFKDAEPGNKEVNVLRTEDALEVKPDIIAAGCPFCNTMLTDGIKHAHKEGEIKVMDVAELIANAQDL